MNAKLRTLTNIHSTGTVVIVRLGDAEEALRASQAAIAGGVRAIEITLSTPRALGVIEQLAKVHGPEISIGAGTVLDEPAVRAAVSVGASFVVSPNLSPAMLRAANRYQVVSISGAYTPTEILLTAEEGADVVKLFPAEGGPEYARAVLAPLAHVPLMPAGGVDAENVHDWFAAGVCAVGVGSSITKAARPDGDYDRVTAAAKKFLAAVEAARA